MKAARAWVLLPSGRRLNLLEPDPWAWTDRDLAIGLSRLIVPDGLLIVLALIVLAALTLAGHEPRPLRRYHLTG